MQISAFDFIPQNISLNQFSNLCQTCLKVSGFLLIWFIYSKFAINLFFQSHILLYFGADIYVASFFFRALEQLSCFR